MKRYFFLLVFLGPMYLGHIASATGKEEGLLQNKSAGSRFSDAVNGLKTRVFGKTKKSESSDALTESGKPKEPDIVILKNAVYFNGKMLKFGDSLESWKKIIAGNPRCFPGGMTMCIWDDLGLKVGTTDKMPENVTLLNLHINFSEAEKDEINSAYQAGQTASKRESYLPKKAFTGNLRLDGYLIDEKTEFSDIASNVDVNRDLRCGSRDCSFPIGIFSEVGNMNLRLDSASTHGRVLRFGITIPSYDVP